MYRDQLYFERVHLFTPILHRRRYLLWAKDACKSRLCICLQHAMWALATSFSAQFQHVGHALYRSCREILEESEAEDEGAGTIEIERAQAWILVTIYEFMQTNSRRGWTSAGRAFRLVQLMRLYEIDKCSDSFVEQNGCARIDWVEIEEKRRTFWMAYCIDRFISLRNEYPLTLQEQVVRP